MIEIEVVKFEILTGNEVARKIMTTNEWNSFKKYNKEFYYRAYQLNFYNSNKN